MAALVSEIFSPTTVDSVAAEAAAKVNIWWMIDRNWLR